MSDNIGRRVEAYVVVPMPAHVLYQIPYATWPVRLVIGVVGALFVGAIFGWWLPRAIRFLGNLPAASGAQALINVAVAVIPVAIGIGPLCVLIALIRNPMAYVTDTGVMQDRAFHSTPVSLTWGEIAHVYCHLGRDAMHELFANQLGPKIVRRCTTPSRG